MGEFLYSALYYKGLSILPATDACILNYLWPIISVISSCILLKETLTVRKAIAIILSFIGIILVTSKGSALTVFQSENFAGSMLCILATVCYGLFNVLNKIKGKDQWCNMTIYFTLTAILSGIYCHMTHQLPIPSPEQCFGILCLGIFIDAIGIVIWAIALQGSEVSSIVNLAYVTPIVSMFLSVIFLKEKIDVYSVLGLALILGGFLLKKKKNLTYVQLSP